MSTTKVKPKYYLKNVWRMLFAATREGKVWVAMDDTALFDRLSVMALTEGRDLQFDLDSAQAAVDAHQKYEEWIGSLAD